MFIRVMFIIGEKDLVVFFEIFDREFCGFCKFLNKCKWDIGFDLENDCFGDYFDEEFMFLGVLELFIL